MVAPGWDGWMNGEMKCRQIGGRQARSCRVTGSVAARCARSRAWGCPRHLEHLRASVSVRGLLDDADRLAAGAPSRPLVHLAQHVLGVEMKTALEVRQQTSPWRSDTPGYMIVPGMREARPRSEWAGSWVEMSEVGGYVKMYEDGELSPGELLNWVLESLPNGSIPEDWRLLPHWLQVDVIECVENLRPGVEGLHGWPRRRQTDGEFDLGIDRLRAWLVSAGLLHSTSAN